MKRSVIYIYIKNPPAKIALQKTFLPCKIKVKSVLKIMEFLQKLIFDKYLVLHQLFIKHQFCVGNLERFPS